MITIWEGNNLLILVAERRSRVCERNRINERRLVYSGPSRIGLYLKGGIYWGDSATCPRATAVPCRSSLPVYLLQLSILVLAVSSFASMHTCVSGGAVQIMERVSALDERDNSRNGLVNGCRCGLSVNRNASRDRQTQRGPSPRLTPPDPAHQAVERAIEH